MSQPTWNDLYQFIQTQMAEDPKFLERELYIEVDAVQVNDPDIIEDGEGWKYVRPKWIKVDNGRHVQFTKFTRKNITTLNINY